MVNRPDTYLGGLGARMAIARNELGVSQARMAEALGMSQRAYQSYETGKRSMPVEALEGFETALDRHLSVTGIRLKSEKRGAIVARWYRSFLEGKEIPMDDVHTWIELLRE